MKYATICIEAEDATGTVGDLTFRLKGESESGRPLALSGNERVGEDDSSESSGHQVGSAISDEQTLHF